MSKSTLRMVPKAVALLLGMFIVLRSSVAAADACDSACGPPTPCCMILWVPWCGCWFDDPDYSASNDEATFTDPERSLACFDEDSAWSSAASASGGTCEMPTASTLL